MAFTFGDIFGYKTNTRLVPAVAISNEYSATSATSGTGLIDLVLVGTNNGQRLTVTVGYNGATGITAGAVQSWLAAGGTGTTAGTSGYAYIVDTNA